MSLALDLAKAERLVTPFYYYDIGALKKNLCAIKQYTQEYKIKVHYALKANSNPKILEIISSFGFGADCVSKWEIERALQSGFAAKDIVFAGVGKRDDELIYAIENNISEINAESIEELVVISKIAIRLNKKVNIAIRINPSIDAKTHKLISTALNTSKFGISHNELPQLIELIKNSERLNFIGLHFHVGSQINDMNIYKRLSKAINDYVIFFKKQNIKINSINVGGGVGIDYDNPDYKIEIRIKEFFKTIQHNIKISDEIQLKCELGRSVIGNFGDIITKVLYKKLVNGHEMLVVDASMTELIRPALYNSFHKIEAFKSYKNIKEYTVVGPICESSDTFGEKVKLPELSRGDYLKIRSCGAYAESMASNYNLRPIAKSYFSDEM